MDDKLESQVQFDLFVMALRTLCREYGVQLCASGYETLEVWALEPTEDPIYMGIIENQITQNSRTRS